MCACLIHCLDRYRRTSLCACCARGPRGNSLPPLQPHRMPRSAVCVSSPLLVFSLVPADLQQPFGRVDPCAALPILDPVASPLPNAIPLHPIRSPCTKAPDAAHSPLFHGTRSSWLTARLCCSLRWLPPLPSKPFPLQHLSGFALPCTSFAVRFTRQRSHVNTSEASRAAGSGPSVSGGSRVLHLRRPPAAVALPDGPQQRPRLEPHLVVLALGICAIKAWAAVCTPCCRLPAAGLAAGTSTPPGR
jgi:hypothetical protein